MTDKTPEEYYQRGYDELIHAMQAGVGIDHRHGSTDGTPKHLRVGVNASMADMAGLVQLLVKKGIITEEEYLEAIKRSMADEVYRYERYLKDKYGLDVRLHGLNGVSFQV